MSFKSNDINNTISRNNYEEYFILYLDNELTPDQRVMVEQFAAAHPDLKEELDMLMSTKLTGEEMELDKTALYADAMKLSLADEGLMLLLDGELPEADRQRLEGQMASDLQLKEHFLLLQRTRLDAREKIPYPNKAELYRRTDKVVAFRPWMRIVAAVVLIAGLSTAYFVSGNKDGGTSSGVAVQTGKKAVTPVQPATVTPSVASEELAQKTIVEPQPVPDGQPDADYKQGAVVKVMPHKNIQSLQEANLQEPLAKLEETDLNPSLEERKTLERTAVISSSTHTSEAATASFDPDKQTLNNSPVTSLLNERTTDIETAGTKGSIKGLLRKATRLIEKRTGIDPTNEDGELLIGALAVKLR
ncbi:MAG TPA: hypothetical protein VHK91_16985 [Flavisolibacter sp.]|nr:hypothetical protein [Flavisolibacter sp.]